MLPQNNWKTTRSSPKSPWFHPLGLSLKFRGADVHRKSTMYTARLGIPAVGALGHKGGNFARCRRIFTINLMAQETCITGRLTGCVRRGMPQRWRETQAMSCRALVTWRAFYNVMSSAQRHCCQLYSNIFSQACDVLFPQWSRNVSGLSNK